MQNIVAVENFLCVCQNIFLKMLKALDHYHHILDRPLSTLRSENYDKIHSSIGFISFADVFAHFNLFIE